MHIKLLSTEPFFISTVFITVIIDIDKSVLHTEKVEKSNFVLFTWK